MTFGNLDPTAEVGTVDVNRRTVEVNRFDEFVGKCECVDEATKAKESIYVANGFIVEVERCECFAEWGPSFGENGCGESDFGWE